MLCNWKKPPKFIKIMVYYFSLFCGSEIHRITWVILPPLWHGLGFLPLLHSVGCWSGQKVFTSVCGALGFSRWPLFATLAFCHSLTRLPQALLQQGSWLCKWKLKLPGFLNTSHSPWTMSLLSSVDQSQESRQNLRGEKIDYSSRVAVWTER